MDSIENEYGFDATFISEVPDYLKCVICQLVLRKPIQIIKCGHKFCAPCFDRIKSYSQLSNTALVCPIDRHAIDLDKVFEDNGIERVIGNLSVKCGNNVTGCVWSGDLRCLKEHEEQCNYSVTNQPTTVQEEVGSSALLKELSQRMLKCEEGLMEKEKDIAFLKFNLQEVKNENKSMEHQLKEMKKKNLELKQVEVKLENMSLKNIILEQKVDLLENQLLLSKKQFEDNQLEVTTIKGGVENVKSILENQQVSISTVRDELEAAKSSLDEKSSTSFINEVKELKSNINDNVEKLRDALNKQSGDSQEGLESLKSHVRNMESIIFCDLSGGCKEVVLQWKIQDYKYHFDQGETLFSPMFFTKIQGYHFKLKVEWRGVDKENLFFGLQLWRENDHMEVLKPFNTPYVLEAQGKKGNTFSKRITLDNIKTFREEHLTIHPGENHTKGFGYANFLAMPALDDYIINDMLYVRCRLIPQ